MRVTMVQMQVLPGQAAVNRARAQQWMEQALASSPDVLVLPEMWLTGYALDRLNEDPSENEQAQHAWLQSFAKQHAVFIVAGSIPIERSGRWRNTSFVYDRSGQIIATYAKVHLFQLMDEHRYFVAGEQFQCTTIDDQRVGVAICYDIRFPEMTRALALAGARIVFCVAQWPWARHAHWETLLRARAIENEVYVVACNAVDPFDPHGMAGYSQVISPWGEVLARAEQQEQLLTVDLDMALVDDVRARIPVWTDRRPDVYDRVVVADAHSIETTS